VVFSTSVIEDPGTIGLRWIKEEKNEDEGEEWMEQERRRGRRRRRRRGRGRGRYPLTSSGPKTELRNR
jgi:hypothetical protein